MAFLEQELRRSGEHFLCRHLCYSNDKSVSHTQRQWFGTEVLNLLRVREYFEKPVQAIDSFPRKVHTAKYMIKVLQKFQALMDLPKAHPKVLGSGNPTLPPPVTHHLGSGEAVYVHVCRTGNGKSGESTLSVPFAVIILPVISAY